MLAKDEKDKARLGTVLYNLLESIRFLAVLLTPFMPDTAKAILEQMNRTRDLYRGYQWACRSWRTDKDPTWSNDGYTRQRENEEYEPRQLDYDTGLPMTEAVRTKISRNLKR